MVERGLFKINNSKEEIMLLGKYTVLMSIEDLKVIQSMVGVCIKHKKELGVTQDTNELRIYKELTDITDMKEE
jgi:hypothetical protein